MFATKTLSQLAEMARASFRANLKGTDAWVWPNNVYVSAKVIAGMAFEVMGFASYISRMMFVHTAPDLDSIALHGAEFGIPRKPAAPGAGSISITAAGAISVDTNAIIERIDGVQYIVVSGGALIGAGTLDLDVVAALDGLNTNAEAGTALTPVSGFTSVDDFTIAVGEDGIILGVDVEDMELWRNRIWFRKKNPPHGGAPADYVMWASSVSGVTRVFVERRWAGPGTVRVFVLLDDLYAADGGIPGDADVQRVAAYVETQVPATAAVTYAAPVAKPINITIKGLTPDNTPTRNAILAELRDTFQRLSRVAGNDTVHDGMPFLATPTSFAVEWIWQSVANAAGERRAKVIAPSDDVPLSAGEMAVLGVVTFEA